MAPRAGTTATSRSRSLASALTGLCLAACAGSAPDSRAEVPARVGAVSSAAGEADPSGNAAVAEPTQQAGPIDAEVVPRGPARDGAGDAQAGPLEAAPPPPPELAEEPFVPTSEESIEALGLRKGYLLSRGRYHDFDLCTYSFEHGLHRDPDRSVTRNDWDLAFGNGGDLLQVSMTAGDRSRLVDLGARRWEDLDVAALPAPVPHVTPTREPALPARPGHVYLVRTADSDSDLLTALRIELLAPGERVAFTWKRID